MQAKAEDKSGDMRYSNHSVDEVAEMIHGTLSIYETKVDALFSMPYFACTCSQLQHVIYIVSCSV